MSETIKVKPYELKELYKAIRKSKGLTHEQTSELLGNTNRQHSWGIENGLKQCSFKTIEKLINGCGGEIEIVVTI